MEEKEKEAEERAQLSALNIRDLIAKARNRRDGLSLEPTEAGDSTSPLTAALADRRAHTDSVLQQAEAEAESAAEAAQAGVQDMNIGTIRRPPRQLSEKGALFVKFLHATDLKDTLEAFHEVCKGCGVELRDGDSPLDFFHRLRDCLMAEVGYSQQTLFRVLEAKVAAMRHNKRCSGLQVVVEGAGPVGLRAAIELSLMDARVTVLEKRSSFTRMNVLHLWDWTCVDLLGLGASGADILGKSFFHISIRKLQHLELQVALLLGVRVLYHAEFETVVPPAAPSDSWGVVAACANTGGSGDAAAAPAAGEVGIEHVVFPANVVIGAAGVGDALIPHLETDLQVVSTSTAIGLVANFVNTHTPAERTLEEFSWAAQYNRALFGKLHDVGVDLENVVYYQDETHYFVMTPTRQCLADFGVIIDNSKPTMAALLARDNVNPQRLREFVRHVTDLFNLPRDVPFVDDMNGAQLFDFSSRTSCQRSCKMHTDKASGKQLLAAVVGDALLEPFWPEGLGINRGFNSALDLAWVVQEHFSTGECVRPERLERDKETLYGLLKTLSAFTRSQVLKDSIDTFATAPETRYKQWVPSV